MDNAVSEALKKDRLVDITTTGRKTGQARRIEIGLFLDPDSDTLYLTGSPGKPRDWYANLRAQPNFTYHFKESIQRDVQATAYPITDEADRRSFFTKLAVRLSRPDREFDVERWVRESPLVSVELNA